MTDADAPLSLDALLLLREGWDFEAKRASGQGGAGAVPVSFWETYSAMANTDGGVVVLGANERADGSVDIVGIPDIQKLERELWNNLGNSQKVSANVLTRDRVRRVAVGDKLALVIEVPRARRADRPVYLNGSWERGTYLRVHEGDRVATPEVARRMLADAQPDRDAQVAEGYVVADLHDESVKRYRQIFSSKRPDHPFLAENDEEFLRKIGALRKDRASGMEGPTLGGMLMLGREEALRELFPHWHLSYTEVGLPSEGRWLDRVWPDGTFNANVFEFYTRVISKLHAGLKVPFALDDAQHRRDDTSAHRALREALVNTLVHADYQGVSGIRVLRDPSGYEFINPGLLLVDAAQVWRGGISESRNPVLQRLFGLLQLGEREGSGGPAIRQAWEEQHWRAPRLQEDVEHGATHLQLRQVSLLADGSVEAARTALGERFDSLMELEKLIAITVCSEEAVDHARLRTISSAHSRDITLALHGLVRKKLLVTSGRGKATRYALAANSQQRRNSEQSGLSFEQTGLSFEQTGLGFEQTGLSSKQSGLSSEQSGLSSEQSGLSSEQSGLSSEQTSGVSSEQSGASQPLRGWNDHGRQLAAVLAYCTGAWRTLPQIAAAVVRAESTVRTKYIPTLLRDGRLERLHPQSPNDPRQAYRTCMKTGDA